MLSHHYIEKLADEVWDGEARVQRSLLWFSTSRLAIQQAWSLESDQTGPFQQRKARRKNPDQEKISSMSFAAWRDGIGIRYSFHVFIYLLFFLATFFVCWSYFNMYTDTLTALKFLKAQEIDVTLLDPLVKFHCSPYQSRYFEITQDPEYRRTFKFYKTLLGEALMDEILQKGLQFLCYSDFEWAISVEWVTNLTLMYVLNSLLGFLQVLFLSKTGRPIRKDLCRDTILLDLVILVQSVIFVLFFQRPLLEKYDEVGGTLAGNIEYNEYYASSPVSKPYFSGMLMITASFRFYFALKATRVFGPFTKLIKLNAFSLMPWLFVTTILLLILGDSLYMLLSESPNTCSSLYSCTQVLIQASVGAVRFEHLGSSWTGFLYLGCASYLFTGVLMNMVIAQINSSYKEVSRKGTLHYYKELFDLRYVYKLDPKYGYLVALEHPFSIILIPSLCVLKCIERRRKREESQRRKEAVFKPNQFLNQELRIQRALKEEESNGTWKCLLCLKCRKVHPRRGVQIQDFNYAMLRAIYLINLLFFVPLFFFANLALIPFGYLAMLFLKFSNLKRVLSIADANANVNLLTVEPKSERCKSALQLFGFLFYGFPWLFIVCFRDTADFAKHCWTQEHSSQYSSFIHSKQKFLPKRFLIYLSKLGQSFLKRAQRNSDQCIIKRRIEEDQNIHMMPMKAFKSVSVNQFMDFLQQIEFLKTPLVKGRRKKNYNLPQRILRQFLHYCVLHRRSTLPYEVPFNVLARIIHSSLSAKEAEEGLLSLQRYNFPLIQGKKRRKTPPLSLRFEELNNKIQYMKEEEERVELEQDEHDLMNSFISLYSRSEGKCNLSSLLCCSIEKTMYATSRVNERVDEMETILLTQVNLEQVFKVKSFK